MIHSPAGGLDQSGVRGFFAYDAVPTNSPPLTQDESLFGNAARTGLIGVGNSHPYYYTITIIPFPGPVSLGLRVLRNKI